MPGQAGAFMLAVTNDGELFMDAWQRNVLLVSPSTLLFVAITLLVKPGQSCARLVPLSGPLVGEAPV